MKYFHMIFYFILMMCGLSLAQSNYYHLPDNFIFEHLNSSVHSNIGTEYEINYYYVLDSLFRKPFYFHEFSDPSGELSDAVLFIASKKPSGFVNGTAGEEILRRDSAFIGIFKDGRFAGITDFIDMSYASTLLNISQLNNDNEIDISIKCNIPDGQSDPNYLWIISWNGSDCRIINDYDPLTRKSKLISSDYFYFIDQDSDNIFEINSCWEDIDSIDNPFSNIDIATIPKMITYGWNGLLYSYLPNIPQYQYGQFLPRNGMEANVNCLVEKTDSIFIIEYTIANSNASKQKISDFYIDTISENSKIIGPDHWETFRFNYLGYSWASMNGGSIKPGNGLSNFKLMGKGLPSIINYYIQGDVAIVSCCGECPEEPIEPTFEMRINNVKTNSVRGLTIGVKDLSYFEKDHIDTLKSFINQCGKIGWIKSQQVMQKYVDYLTASKTAIQQNDIQTAKTNLNKILAEADADSAAEITHEAYALIRYNAEYILKNIPDVPEGISVKLISSMGSNLTGGTLQYYEGSWKEAINNNDGTFTINTDKKTISLRMSYAYGSQTKSNITVGTDTIVFQTVTAKVILQNSAGNTIDQGRVQYYAGAWREFGITSGGITEKELLPGNYSFRMTYDFASIDKQQDITLNPDVMFQTIKTKVELRNSEGNLLDQGTVQYYSGAWREFGVTQNGIAEKELLSKKYSFRMTYGFASADKEQDLVVNPTVTFQTVKAQVELKSSEGNLIDQGIVQYYSGAWREFGVTQNGIAQKELLPKKYSFRMTYGFASTDKEQDLVVNPTVAFQTVRAQVELRNSEGNLIDEGTVQYYSGAWREFGVTQNGIAQKELLPKNYEFRITHNYISGSKQQDVSVNSTLVFNTVLCTIRVINSLTGNPAPDAQASYYSGAWRVIGSTSSSGEISKELLPADLTFRVKSGAKQLDKKQNILSNNLVEFSLEP